MKPSLVIVLGLAVFVTLLPPSRADGVKISLPPETAKVKPGPGAALVTAQCIICHSADYISTQPKLSRTAWKASVQKMKEKYGAPIVAEQTDALVDYLVKNYGVETPAATTPAK